MGSRPFVRDFIHPANARVVYTHVCNIYRIYNIITENIAGVRVVSDVFVLQQRLPLALLAVPHVERGVQFNDDDDDDDLLFDSTPGASM